MMRNMQEALRGPLAEICGDGIDPYFPTAEQLADGATLPTYVHPLAFHGYSETEMAELLHRLGWVRPADTDPNSSNCLLNTFAIDVHMRQLGFHPYAHELATLVREGMVAREDALERIEAVPNRSTLESVRAKLGV